MLRRWSIRRFAVFGIAAQFLALIRTLGEVFRLKYFDAARYTVAGLEPFIRAALFTSVLIAFAVGTFAMTRYRIALTIAVVNVAGLFVYRIFFM